MSLRLGIISLLVVGQFWSVKAQDAHFTQFYAAPTYLSPAFVGTSIQSRFGMNYRNQWPAISNAFVTYNAFYDQYMPDLNSGFGLLLNHDRAGAGALSNTSLALQYAYEIRLSRQFSLRPGLQFGYTRKGIHVDRLTFGDQLIRNGAEETFEVLNAETIGLFDVSYGLLLFSEKYWFGFSQHHVNEPNEAVTNGISAIPMKFSAHGGARIKIQNPRKRKSKKDVVLAFNYKKQGPYNQLDFGTYLELNPMVFGLWYRGLPTKSNGYEYVNHDGLNLVVGYHDRNYKIAYSVDLTLSQLAIGQTAGAHEISLIYEWANKKNRRLSKRRIIPCAKF